MVATKKKPETAAENRRLGRGERRRRRPLVEVKRGEKTLWRRVRAEKVQA